MVLHQAFPALVVRRNDDEQLTCAVETLAFDDLPPGEVVIEVAYSSLNYKDALATRAQPGIVKELPHVPGIDCAGTVAMSSVDVIQVGTKVLVTGYDQGAPRWGGHSAFVRVPAAWIVPLPDGISPRDAMIYGTAGFTAAQCVDAIVHHGIEPDRGEVIVTGATGGVGTVAIALLAHLGYEVVAVTGKPELAKPLQRLGATRVIGRDEVDDTSGKPLLSEHWAAAVDTVGGNTLSTLLRSTKHRGCVAACGLVGGHELPLTVYPFILRGVTLAGIDSAKCPREPRERMWQHLFGDWNVLERLEPLVREVTLAEVPAEAEKMLAGENSGRILVRPE